MILRSVSTLILLSVCLIVPGFAQTTASSLSVSGIVISNISNAIYVASVAGTATIAGVGTGSFQLSGQLYSQGAPGTNPDPTVAYFPGTFTFTLPTGETLTGTTNFRLAPFFPYQTSITAGSGSLTITGGTGRYAGTTGTFPNLTMSVQPNARTTSPASGTALGDPTQITGSGSLQLPASAAPNQAPLPGTLLLMATAVAALMLWLRRHPDALLPRNQS